MGTRDKMAIERTRLANERTLLAYIRTALVVFASGATLFKLFPSDRFLFFIALTLMIIGAGVTMLGIYTYSKTKRGLISKVVISQ